MKQICSIPNYPIQMWNTLEPYHTDKLTDFILIGCTECQCVQLENIIDPSVLYTNGYSTPLFSSIWIKHHKTFCGFIQSNTVNKTYLEIGANAGQLYKLLAEGDNIKYTALDMVRHPSLPEEVSCIEGNCEEFDYSKHSTIILSHVFEHLLNPHAFLESIRKSEVEEVFISIPDFHALLEEGYVTLLTTQHTFYCGEEYIKYLFSRYGYYCEVSTLFDKHSVMLKFKRGSEMAIPLIPRRNYIDDVSNLFIEYNRRSKEIDITNECYICPAGMYGQMLYLTLINNTSNIIGFIDGDPKKNGTRLYGTDKLTYSPSNLLKYKDKKINVILCKSPYEKEILAYLNDYSSCINLIKM